MSCSNRSKAMLLLNCSGSDATYAVQSVQCIETLQRLNAPATDDLTKTKESSAGVAVSHRRHLFIDDLSVTIIVWLHLHVLEASMIDACPNCRLWSPTPTRPFDKVVLAPCIPAAASESIPSDARRTLCSEIGAYSRTRPGAIGQTASVGFVAARLKVPSACKVVGSRYP